MKMRRFKYSLALDPKVVESLNHDGKLVRNISMDEVHKHNGKPNYKILNDTEFEKELLNKLVEETFEVYEAKNKEEVVSELGDVIEVIEALLELKKITWQELIQAKNEKKASRGGFDQRIFIQSIDLPDSPSRLLKYVLERPDKYPEVL